MTCTSADAVTVVVADALLFAVFVSVAVGPTFAVTIIVPACGCPCAMTVNVELAPLASTAPMQRAGRADERAPADGQRNAWKLGIRAGIRDRDCVACVLRRND